MYIYSACVYVYIYIYIYIYIYTLTCIVCVYQSIYLSSYL